MTSCLKFRIV